jgi:phosphoglycolate phosphatase-like HAD superfamily hydrolase
VKKFQEKVGFKVESMLTFWEDHFGTKLSDLANNIVERYELEAVLNSKPYDDVKPALDSFKGVVYLASMQSEKAINFFLDKYDLKKYFREIISRNRFGNKKKQIQYIMDKEIEHEKFVLVDDSKRNIRICQRQGLSCILFNRKSGDNLIDAIKNVRAV